jgi:indolepyruvate ferredoxin oxidoreductase beta subunit
MEAGRAVQRGFVSPDRTTLIASTNRVYSMTEKTAVADGQVDEAKLIEAGGTAAKKFVCGDFARLAQDARSVISASLFGALAATEALPFTRRQFEEAVERGGVGVASSLAAFAAGYAAASAGAVVTASPLANKEPVAGKQPVGQSVGPRLRALAERVGAEFPAESHEILLAGTVRCADFQDEKYAADYLRQLEPVRDLDRQHGRGDYVLLRETGRYLALWMSYEDAIRVADLKIRRTRFERVQKEVRASGNQLVQINEFLHPGIQEIADILPVGFGRWLMKSGTAKRAIDRFTHGGKKLRTTSLSGFLQLYVLANMRPLRRRSLRFQEELRAIRGWLGLVTAVAAEDYALALEVAECPRLVKGYGETHIRGMKKFDSLMASIPRMRRTDNPAAWMKKLREAGLADEGGEKLAAVLQELPA